MINFARLLLLSICGLFLLSSCQEDEKPIDNSSQIIGYWQNSSDYAENIEMATYYSFSENGKYQSFTSYVNTSSNELLGYSSRSSGDFSLLDDILTTQTTLVYNLPESADAPYVANAELVQTTANYSSTRKVVFAEDKMTWISPGCGPLENCIGDQVFERYTPIEF